jgi:chromosome segregation ATPase
MSSEILAMKEAYERVTEIANNLEADNARLEADLSAWNVAHQECLAQLRGKVAELDKCRENKAALKSDNARLREALEAMVTATSNFNQGLAAARDMADAALAAHKQARSKGE